MPRQAHPTDAAADICALSLYNPHLDTYTDIPPEGLPLEFGIPLVFGTGVSLELPPGYRCTAWSRSGLSAREGIEVGAGLIDNGYRGELKVVLENHTKGHDFYVRKGDRIAQICIEKFEVPSFVVSDQLSESDRGLKGLGSTGVSSHGE